jgi:hypothetical protein
LRVCSCVSVGMRSACQHEHVCTYCASFQPGAAVPCTPHPSDIPPPAPFDAMFVVHFSLFYCCRSGAACIAGKLERETRHGDHFSRGWPIELSIELIGLYYVRRCSKACAVSARSCALVAHVL